MFDFLPRILWHCLKSAFNPSVTIFDDYTSGFRAWPILDTDGIRILSVARYLAIASILIWAHVFKSRWYRIAFRHKWYFVTKQQYARFYKPIKVFSRFQVTTRVIAWNDESFIRRVEFHQNGELRAKIYLQVFTLSSTFRKVLTSEVLSKSSLTNCSSGELPREIANWI